MDKNPTPIAPEASTDEPASPCNLQPAPARAEAPTSPFDPAGRDRSGHPVFASPEAERLYWTAYMDGARAAAPAAPDDDGLGFDPVPVRHRIDGWTPEKQREYVEALADTGVARIAAQRVGMTEQSANRLRRRADARSFDLACEAAQRIGARRILSHACERAIEGQVKRHYYRGELVGEERVYDNRLLVALLGRLAPQLEPSAESLAVEKNWQPFLDALEQGRPAPALSLETAPPPDAELATARLPALDDEPGQDGEEDSGWSGAECTQDDDGTWWTEFPPPLGFDGIEEGSWGDYGYRRTLTVAELAVIQADVAEEEAEDLAKARARRDLYFGFAGDGEADGAGPHEGLGAGAEPEGEPPAREAAPEGSSGPLFLRTGCETYELSAAKASPPAPGLGGGASEDEPSFHSSTQPGRSPIAAPTTGG